MDLTYSIRALDDKIYGPYPLDSIQGWIQEGRINAETPMNRSDTGTWQRAGNFTELQFQRETDHPAAPSPYQSTPPNLPSGSMDTSPSGGYRDLSVLKSGASWYYWIASLTAVNFGAWLAGSSMRFVIGTELIDVINAFCEGAGIKGVAIALDVLLIAFFVVCGIFAHKGHIWAFVSGMAVYLLDTILCAFNREWLGVAFHCLALFSLSSALRLAWQMRNS
jgi:hypothetical protein